MTQVAEQDYTEVSPDTDQNQFLTFTLGGEVYAIDILSIRVAPVVDLATPAREGA